MARKGMMIGKGKGYKNVIGKDPHIHSQSAKGMKQPQSVNIIITPALKRDSYANLKKKGIKLSKNGDADKDGVKNSKDCKPLNFKKQDDEVVKEIEFDPTVDEDNETAFEQVKGRTQALVQRGIRAGKEAYAKYEKGQEEKKIQRNKEDIDIAKHPALRELENQQKKVDALNYKLSNLPEDSEHEEEMFEQLEAEQEELDILKDTIESIKLEDYSDKQLKELAVRHDAEEETDLLGFSKPNAYEQEYIRRIESRAKVEEKLSEEQESFDKKMLAEKPLEKFSDRELKKLGSDARYETESFFGSSENRYKDEYLKRLEKRREIAKEIREANKEPKEDKEGLFGGWL